MSEYRRQTQEFLDRAIAESRLPGILALVRDGDRRWIGTAGVADQDKGGAREPDHQFRIGSMTKVFTATVTLQVVAEGRLSLDDTLEKWLPGVLSGGAEGGPDGSRITIRQLLGHTSGIFGFTSDPATWMLPDPRPEDLVRIAATHPATFAPGDGWAYSNTNYVLLGMILQRVTGSPYAEELNRRIVEPLGLAGTYQPAPGEIVLRGPHSRHYTTMDLSTLEESGPDGPFYDITDVDMSWAWMTGDVVSTVEDLDRFCTALLRGELLPPAEQKEMFAAVSTKDPDWVPNTAYGLGISSVLLSRGATLWGHGGALPGYWSYAYGTRDGDRMVVVSVNGDWTAGRWKDPIGLFTNLLEEEFSV